MRIGFVELVLLLFIASLTVGPNVALFVDRWLRRAQRTGHEVILHIDYDK